MSPTATRRIIGILGYVVLGTLPGLVKYFQHQEQPGDYRAVGHQKQSVDNRDLSDQEQPVDYRDPSYRESVAAELIQMVAEAKKDDRWGTLEFNLWLLTQARLMKIGYPKVKAVPMDDTQFLQSYRRIPCDGKLTTGCYNPSARRILYVAADARPDPYGRDDRDETLVHEIRHALLHQAGYSEWRCAGHRDPECPVELWDIDELEEYRALTR